MPLNYATEAWRRMIDRGDYMRDTQWRRGFGLLSGHGLSFDLQMYDGQAADGVNLARRLPETTIIVEHLAWALDLSSEGFDQWREHLHALSQCSNVFLKLSGIGCVFRDSDPGWIPALVVAGRELFRSETLHVRQQLPTGYDLPRLQNAFENVCGSFCRLLSRRTGGTFLGNSATSLPIVI